VIDLFSSSDEEDFVADTSRDFEFAQRLYAELNRDLLGTPDDGKVIILSDPNEDKVEVHEEKFVGAKDAAASAAVNLVSTASTDDTGTPAASLADANDDPRMVRNDSSDGLAPGPKMKEGSGGGDEAGVPYAAAPKMASATGVLQGELHSVLLPFFFLCAEEWDGDTELLLTLMLFMHANNFCNLLYFSYILDIVLDFK
jgi:hypothetical protein